MPDVMAGRINLGYVIFLSATAALGGLLFGSDIAIIAGAGPFLTHHFQLNDLSLGWAFSSLLFGCVIGSTVAGRLTNPVGTPRIFNDHAQFTPRRHEAVAGETPRVLRAVFGFHAPPRGAHAPAFQEPDFALQRIGVFLRR